MPRNYLDRTKDAKVTGARIRSVRGYRRRADELFAKALRGEISWGNARSGAAILQASAELMMAENLLAIRGVKDEEVQHSLGANGGLEGAMGKLVPHVRKKVTKKVGTDKNGNDVEEITVSYDSEGEDPGLIDAAEIAALE